MSLNVPIITITAVGDWTYFQWFLLGFYELEAQGCARLCFDLPLLDRMLSMCPNNRILFGVLCRVKAKRPSAYGLRGQVVFPSGLVKQFCIDNMDSPFLFDEDALRSVDAYFKMQCPKDLHTDGFRISSSVVIPWSSCECDEKLNSGTPRKPRKPIPNFEDYTEKIFPLMVGPRMLARGCSKKALSDGYKNYLSSRRVIKEKKLMCYFGTSEGPKCESNVQIPDVNWEGDLMGYYGAALSHPNVKRKKIADLINKMNSSDYDGRVIKKGNADSKEGQRNEKLVVPIEEFCNHIASFEYNFNVSGYRLSIPNRFIESFIVGTAIISDKLSVHWYEPFGEEVIETAEMGYLPDDQVDWDKVEYDIKHLKTTNPEKIIDRFESKWAPSAVAAYILQVLGGSKAPV